MPYSGWSSAYSVSGILMQLSAFLFDENVPQEYNDSIHSNKVSETDVSKLGLTINSFECSKCGHSPTDNFPKVNKSNLLQSGYFPSLVRKPTFVEITSKENKLSFSKISKVEEPKYVGRLSMYYFDVMGKDVLMKILGYLPDFSDISHLSDTCLFFQKFIKKHSIFESRELVCYHTKIHFSDKKTILGIGLNITHFGNKNIETMIPYFDLLSWDAFHNMKVNKSVWNNPITHFMPLIIRPDHAYISSDVFQHCLNKICPTNHTIDDKILYVIPKLMNLMAVSCVIDNGKITRQLSEKAILGYCSFHHMLLYYVDKYPKVETKINKIIDNFLKFPDSRTKKDIPDLGVILVYLTISKKKWDDISIELFKEVCIRQVRWNIKTKAWLGNVRNDKVDKNGVNWSRIETTFKVSKTALRLLMFQSYFLQEIGKPKDMSHKTVLENYNTRLGLPTNEMKQKFHGKTKQILEIDNYPDFFKEINVECPSPKYLTNLLVKCVHESERLRYH
jgi:hypothetical protein